MRRGVTAEVHDEVDPAEGGGDGVIGGEGGHLLRYMMKLIQPRKRAIQAPRHCHTHGVLLMGSSSTMVEIIITHGIRLKKLNR